MKMRGASRSHLNFALALLFAAICCWPALASAEKKRVGIPRFDGQQEALIRKVVMQVVKGKGYELVRSREIDDAAKSAGVSLDSNDGFQSLAKELSLSAIVTGEVGKKKAKLTVRNGADGSVTGEGAFAGANPKKLAVEVAKTFWRRLGSAIERGKVPGGAKKPSKSAAPASAEDNEEDQEAVAAANEKGDDKEKEEKAEEKPAKSEEKNAETKSSEEEEKPKKKHRKADEEAAASSGGGTAHLRYLELGAGVHAFKRDLSYHQDRDGVLRPYNLTAPALALDAVWYPGAAGGSDGALANIGVEGNLEIGFGLKSKDSAGLSYPTTVHDYNAGLRYRIPFGDGGEVDVSGTGGEHAFKLGSGDNAPRANLANLPDTIYRYLQFGARLRVPIGPAAVYVGAAYRYILTPGQIKDNYFPHLSVGGIVGEGGVTFSLTPLIELRAGVDVRRYFYDFKTQAGDKFIVGGAIDQYITGVFMVAITLDGGDKH